DFADRAKLASIASVTSYGVSGQVKTTLARAESLAIGPHVLHDVIVSSGINVHGTREEADGLLGYDFLAGAIIDVDFVKKTLAIFDPAAFDVTGAGIAVNPDLGGGVPVVPVTFEHRVTAHLVLDTGDPMAVIVSDDLYGPGKVTMRFEGYANLAGVSGASQDRSPCGHAPDIQLGTIDYGNVPICFSKNHDLFGADGGIIGFDFLKHFNLTFDYPHARMFLTPNKQ
ncbi:MAG: retropepsin-like domain-containing protein, partial [Candidatus Eremiobacteraeota bacterium]|nr:retropepsin-like domain-containing protein [Candidatus Eremiobacteraeota bacterium]